MPEGLEGTKAALAEYLTDPDNCITPPTAPGAQMATADEVFGADYVHVPAWWCVIHLGIAKGDAHGCDEAADTRYCHMFQLGYQAAQIDGSTDA